MEVVAEDTPLPVQEPPTPVAIEEPPAPVVFEAPVTPIVAEQLAAPAGDRSTPQETTVDATPEEEVSDPALIALSERPLEPVVESAVDAVTMPEPVADAASTVRSTGEADPPRDAEAPGRQERGYPEVAGLAPRSEAVKAIVGNASWAVEDDGDDQAQSRWAWLGTKRAAAVILLLLAAEIAYTVKLNTQRTSNKSATPPATHMTVPSTTAPRAQVPTVVPTTVPPTTIPAPAPTTTPASAPVPAAAAVQSVPLEPCTTGDLNVATTTSGSYAVGAPVTITTTVTAVHSCTFQPAAVGPGNCPTWVVVVDQSNNPVFPSSTETETCNPPAGQTMNPGSSETVSIPWTPTTAGTFDAIGTWGWAPASGPPIQVNAPAPTFVIS
jgi:hypothetical protein